MMRFRWFSYDENQQPIQSPVYCGCKNRVLRPGFQQDESDVARQRFFHSLSDSRPADLRPTLRDQASKHPLDHFPPSQPLQPLRPNPRLTPVRSGKLAADGADSVRVVAQVHGPQYGLVGIGHLQPHVAHRNTPQNRWEPPTRPESRQG